MGESIDTFLVVNGDIFYILWFVFHLSISFVMYVYSFSKFAGYDRVFQTSVAVGQPGDLLQTTDDFLLHLGQEKTFPELGGSRVAEQDIRVVYP
jgi:hypothetical protein